jgi:lauroyl/myristoyl acyltransferase
VLAYRTGAIAAQVLPDSVGRSIARAAGVTAARLPLPAISRRREMVGRHLRRVCGGDLERRQHRALVADAFASYGRYWAESLQLPNMSPAEIGARFSMEGFEHLEAVLDRGRGAIVALPHLGGWEWGGAYIANRGHRPTVVVETLEPPELFEWFRELRHQLGMEVVPADRHAAAAVLRALRANRIVCLLSDRSLSAGSGVEVTFFGERTHLPGGPATFALRTGAGILPAAVYFTARGGHRAVVRPPLRVEKTGSMRADISRITQALAGELEGLIAAAPTQWHLMSPNWPSDHQPEL